MRGNASIICRDTAVVASMTRTNRLDTQNAHALTSFCNNHTIVRVDTSAILCPSDIYRQIAFINSARRRDHIQFVNTRLTEVEGYNLWQNL